MHELLVMNCLVLNIYFDLWLTRGMLVAIHAKGFVHRSSKVEAITGTFSLKYQSCLKKLHPKLA